MADTGPWPWHPATPPQTPAKWGQASDGGKADSNDPVQIQRCWTRPRRARLGDRNTWKAGQRQVGTAESPLDTLCPCERPDARSRKCPALRGSPGPRLRPLAGSLQPLSGFKREPRRQPQRRSQFVPSQLLPSSSRSKQTNVSLKTQARYQLSLVHSGKVCAASVSPRVPAHTRRELATRVVNKALAGRASGSSGDPASH